MAKHKPSMVYCAYKFGHYPNAEITTVDKTKIKIAVFPYKGRDGFAFAITRKLGKMIALRINQCLEDTK